MQTTQTYGHLTIEEIVNYMQVNFKEGKFVMRMAATGNGEDADCHRHTQRAKTNGNNIDNKIKEDEIKDYILQKKIHKKAPKRTNMLVLKQCTHNM